jgi:hypothetical protein
MPRYFFHTEDGSCFPDEQGSVLPDLEAAKVAALCTFGELLREMQAEFWKEGGLRLIVQDEAGMTLFTLDMSVIGSPVLQAVRPRRSG